MENKKYTKAKILENVEVSKNVFKLVLEGKFKGNPGQFYMLKSWEESPLLPRPFGICDLKDNSITFLYEVVGKGTGIMSSLRVGEYMEILGPLGNGFEIFENKKSAIVSGGIGIAPMIYLSKFLKNVDLYTGFRDTPYMTNAFENISKNIISTDTGSYGEKGFITDFVEDKYDVIYACGPNPMMRSLKNRNLSAKEYYSLEAHMACGIGACLGCTVKTVNGLKRVCKDGPIFEKDEVIF